MDLPPSTVDAESASLVASVKEVAVAAAAVGLIESLGCCLELVGPVGYSLEAVVDVTLVAH